MVSNFNFARIPHLLFGTGKFDKLPSIIHHYGQTVLLVTGSTSFARSPYADKLFEALNNNNIEYFQTRILKEPSPSDIDEVVRLFRWNHISVVISIGGGSVLDAGKAIAAMLPSAEPVKDYLEKVGTKTHDGSKIPFIAIPTTAGTGSETTKNAVISEVGEEGFKRSLRHDNFVPDYAIVDPLLSLKCPADITAASGMDAFTQLLESYVSVKAGPLTDALAMEGLDAIKGSLLSICQDGDNLDARTGMAYASMLSGITLANAGLGVIHGFASSLGGFYDIPHGVVCGTLMGIVNQMNVEKLLAQPEDSEALEKYIQLGRYFITEENKNREYYARAFADYVAELVEQLSIPRLSEFGITADDFDRIIADTGNKNNPVSFTPEDMERVLTERL